MANGEWNAMEWRMANRIEWIGESNGLPDHVSYIREGEGEGKGEGEGGGEAVATSTSTATPPAPIPIHSRPQDTYIPRPTPDNAEMQK